MRIALISDIHGNLPALEAVLSDARRRGVDVIANLGDNLSGPLLPRETAQLLMSEAIPSLKGNHDRQLLTEGPSWSDENDAFAHVQLTPPEREWLAGLPATLRPEADVLLCHGTPSSDATYFLETVDPTGMHLASLDDIDARMGTERAALVACGHTHTPRMVRTTHGQLIVNPGSVGVPAFEDDHPWRHYAETGSPDARYAIVERRDGRWSAALIAVPYDHAPMAALALQRGHPDWARALSTGFAR